VTDPIVFPDDTLFFDIETHSITERYAWTPREYFRLGGYSWGESEEVFITDDYDEMIEVIRQATIRVGHNIHAFDLSVLFGVDSDEALQMAREYSVFDTMTHATLVMPAPYKYVDYKGNSQTVVKPEQARKWFKLANLAHHLKVPGKLLDLKDLAEKYEYDIVPILKKDGTPGKRVQKIRKPDVCCGFGHIPIDVDDPDEDRAQDALMFRDYLRDDVLAARHVARALIGLDSAPGRYEWDEQFSAGILAQISRNGVRVDQDETKALIYEQDWDAAHTLDWLRDRFGFPVSDKKKPLQSNEGKEAVLKAMTELGISTNGLGRTDKGNLSFGADSIREACGYVSTNKGWEPTEAVPEEVQKFADALAVLAGQRSMPELTWACMHPDGKVHPEIASLQKSGRNSVTEPGLTVYDKRYKHLLLPDSDWEGLCGFDYSNADARVVAALSGDEAFAVRFQPGQDGHLINAYAVWGKELVDTDVEYYRNKMSKRMGHAWGYRVGATTLHKNTGIAESVCKVFLTGLNKAFPGVVAWQNAVVAKASSLGYVKNLWGRKMKVDPKRVFTQAPALEGQGGTTEIMKRGMFKMPNRLIRMIKIPIHDELLASIPLATFEEDRALFVKCLSSELDPPGGQRVEFPVGSTPKPARNWREAAH